MSAFFLPTKAAICGSPCWKAAVAAWFIASGPHLKAMRTTPHHYGKVGQYTSHRSKFVERISALGETTMEQLAVELRAEHMVAQYKGEVELANDINVLRDILGGDDIGRR